MNALKNTALYITCYIVLEKSPQIYEKARRVVFKSYYKARQDFIDDLSVLYSKINDLIDEDFRKTVRNEIDDNYIDIYRLLVKYHNYNNNKSINGNNDFDADFTENKYIEYSKKIKRISDKIAFKK